jgi:hypothetical protein
MQPQAVRQIRLLENGHTGLDVPSRVLEDRQHPSRWAVFFDRHGIRWSMSRRFETPALPARLPLRAAAYSKRDRNWQPA